MRFLAHSFLISHFSLLVSAFMIVFIFTSCDKLPGEADVEAKPEGRVVDRVTLASGGVIQGKIVEETEEGLRIDWQGGIVSCDDAQEDGCRRQRG